eukprot:8997252-Prorocentrum_lima.AAC.1
MTSSLVGSEMCIRDRGKDINCCPGWALQLWSGLSSKDVWKKTHGWRFYCDCLLYTSDAADDM